MGVRYLIFPQAPLSIRAFILAGDSRDPLSFCFSSSMLHEFYGHVKQEKNRKNRDLILTYLLRGVLSCLFG